MCFNVTFNDLLRRRNLFCARFKRDDLKEKIYLKDSIVRIKI